MARYIDADKVHEEIEKLQIPLESNDDKIWNKNRPFYKGLAMARGVINDTPTADVIPKSDVASIFDELIKEANEIAERYAKWADEATDYVRIDYRGAQKGAILTLLKIAELKKKYTEGDHDRGQSKDN